jgi:redox-regulated HSP33 family molecular chaperone
VDRDRALPRRDGALRVQLLEGRGRVQVIQQPSARNNYTAIVRVKDAQRGADTYRFATYFDPEDDYRNDDRWEDRGDVWGEGTSGQRVMRWRGTVDGDVRISMRGSSVGYVVASGDQPRGVNSSGALPRREGLLSVSLHQGRGTVSVIQHPSSYNNYTAVVRVSDPQGSSGYYDFDLVWR